MDLILWRHAEAEEVGSDDLALDLGRELTAKGQKQAARVAAWLDRQLPDLARVYSSPAVRCEQTAQALGRKFKLKDELGPSASANDLLQLAQWPHSRHAVVIVGHQPCMGELLARLLNLSHGSLPVRKGAVWWLRTRERDGHEQTVVVAVQSPDTV